MLEPLFVPSNILLVVIPLISLPPMGKHACCPVDNELVCVFSGLETDGIYRVSGNLAIIQKLRFAVNHGKTSKDYTDL